MDLSDMPLDKQQQTMMWQQNQYMDSGINSGATTQVSHFYAGYSHKSMILICCEFNSVGGLS
jgi:hypothetical protein